MQHVDQANNQAANPATWAIDRLARRPMVNTTVKAKYLLSLLLCIILAACQGSDTEDLRNYVKDVKARQKSHIPPLPKVKSYETYTYNEKDLRDPFIPTTKVRPTQVTSNNGIVPNFKRKREVLEQFPLDTLKMVGILERNKQRWALIKSEDGTLYRTKTGRYIGQNNGKITRITENALELTEIVPDGLGGWVKRQATLSVTQ